MRILIEKQSRVRKREILDIDIEDLFELKPVEEKVESAIC
jgi:hypothetical protein